MAKSGPKLAAKEPNIIHQKSIQVDAKALFKALSKGVIHTASGKWDEAGIDASEVLTAIGLDTKPEELVFLLISRSITTAIFELVGESGSQNLINSDKEFNSLLEQSKFSISAKEIFFDKNFLDRPDESIFVKEIRSLFTKWLEAAGLTNSSAIATANRLPSYFVYALNQEWRKNAKTYQPIIDAMETPFSKAGDREMAWKAYSSLLKRRVHESIFDEPFSLSQIYVPLNAFYYEEENIEQSTAKTSQYNRKRRRIVSLEKELREWLSSPIAQEAVRVISGGPGSGKSSFARIFAASLSDNINIKVLYIPLHLIDASKDFAEEIGRFVRDEGVLLQNPLDHESHEPNLLIILDGLDELASQGKAAAETARAFVREVDRTVERRNSLGIKLRILISSRELVVQENESEFRRPRQILTLLPYNLPNKIYLGERRFVRDGDEYYDPGGLLDEDLRHLWWRKYGELTGKTYLGLPDELKREDLAEITAQPLLNYLVGLSFTRGKLDFSKEINLNSIYSDLIAAVHERGYEKQRHINIRHMDLKDFTRILEEIGLSAWHGDGRTTTVQEIETHCRVSGLDNLLDAFKEGAREGVTRLLAAFFFRKYGQRASGDPTFIFTHKSFGEYLTALRLMRAMKRINRELESRLKDSDDGWNERDALKHWAEICGPNPISKYLHIFLLNEVNLQSEELFQCQEKFVKLFSYMLRYGMPMDQLQIVPFREAVYQSRNAEETLFAALNACARVTRQISKIDYPNATAFGAWFKKIQGQRAGNEQVFAAECLSYLNLNRIILRTNDFSMANFSSSYLKGADLSVAYLTGSNLNGADFSEANLCEANLSKANLSKANLSKANLSKANLREANLCEANLGEADLNEANLSKANLNKANLSKANLSKANLREANLRIADLSGAALRGGDLCNADLNGADISGANLIDAKLNKANLHRSKLRGADVSGANLNEAKLCEANFIDADLRRVDLTKANLNRADLRRADLSEATLIRADLREADLSEAKLIGVNFYGADLRGSILNDADFKESNLSGADLSEATLLHADLSETSLIGAIIGKANLDKAILPYKSKSSLH